MNGEKKIHGLAAYLYQPELELKEILNNESTYESFDMRVMVVGKYGVGKTTLVMLLIGDDIPKTPSPTDGISVIGGRCGLDVSTKVWIRLDKDSYNVNEFMYNRMLIPPTQDDIKSQGDKQTGRQQLNKSTDKAPGTTQSQSKPVNPTEESGVEVGNRYVIPKSEQDITILNSATNLHEVQENVILQPASDHVNYREQEEESLGAATSDPDSKKPASTHPEIQFTKSKIKTKLSKNEYKKRLELALKNSTYKIQMGRLFFWDFGGQYVFYTTHQSFLT